MRVRVWQHTHLRCSARTAAQSGGCTGAHRRGTAAAQSTLSSPGSSLETVRLRTGDAEPAGANSRHALVPGVPCAAVGLRRKKGHAPILLGKMASSSSIPWTQFMSWSTYSACQSESRHPGQRHTGYCFEGEATAPGAESFVGFLKLTPSCQWYSYLRFVAVSISISRRRARLWMPRSAAQCIAVPCRAGRRATRDPCTCPEVAEGQTHLGPAVMTGHSSLLQNSVIVP